MRAWLSGIGYLERTTFLGRWIRARRVLARPEAAFVSARYGPIRETGRYTKTLHVEGLYGAAQNGALLHHSYPTLSDYIDHMNRYSSLGAEMVVAKSNGKVRFSVSNIVLRPLATFIYNYFFRLGFLDGREGLLLHLYHAVYVSWKYAKAWELSRPNSTMSS